MHMQPEMDPVLLIEQVALTVERHESEIKDLRKFILGNGEPKRGLLWLATMQQESIDNLQKLLAAATAASTTALNQHRLDGHYSRQPWYFRMAFDVAKSVVVWALIGIFALAILGARVSIGRTP